MSLVSGPPHPLPGVPRGEAPLDHQSPGPAGAVLPAAVPAATSARPAGLSESAISTLAQLCRLLADESRLRILNYLVQMDEINVRRLCELLAQSQPAVSHHLALLKEAGLIECRRDGKHNFYRLVTKQCQAHFDSLFGIAEGEMRKVRIEKGWLTYGRDGVA